MTKPVIATVLLAVMAAAWYAALRPVASSGGPARPSPAARRPAADEAVPVLRLERLRRAPAPYAGASNTRDPFRGAVQSGPVASSMTVREGRPASRQVPPDAVSAPVARTGPVGPRVDLIGVAVATQEGAVVRTAILSGPSGVQHVRAGDRVDRGYRVTQIDATVVTLTSEADGAVVRLSLRP